jgi:hypothetical protein
VRGQAVCQRKQAENAKEEWQTLRESCESPDVKKETSSPGRLWFLELRNVGFLHQKKEVAKHDWHMHC